MTFCCAQNSQVKVDSEKRVREIFIQVENKHSVEWCRTKGSTRVTNKSLLLCGLDKHAPSSFNWMYPGTSTRYLDSVFCVALLVCLQSWSVFSPHRETGSINQRELPFPSRAAMTLNCMHAIWRRSAAAAIR